MYQTCPKCGHQRSPADDHHTDTCPACGLIFSKWLKQQYAQAEQPRAANFDTEPDSGGRLTATAMELQQLLFTVDAPRDAISFWGRVLLLLAFSVWGAYFISLDFESNAIGQSFMHAINLVFHEAGHVIFMIFGSHFITTLGGTLGQLLMPTIVMAVMLFVQRDPFAAALGLWWLGQSFMDCAPYINDARALELPLLGGGTGADKPGMHDWENILLDLGMIEYDHQIAHLFDGIGSVLILMAIAWGCYILFRQWQLGHTRT